MNLSLIGKTALVCGSSQGMGKAIAKQLSEQGANVVLLARNKEKLEAVHKELDHSQGQDHHILVADFTKPEQVKDAVEGFLKTPEAAIHILVNNTGGPAPGPANSANTEDFLAAFQQHLVCNHELMKLALPSMKEDHFGRIINVISTSVKQPLNGLGVSNTVRGAVANWAKTLANELGEFNITVNNVLPGATNTVRLEAIIQNKAEKKGVSIEEMEQEEKSIIPMKRFGTAQEFANAVGFLASPAAGYITGINLPVDGGRTSCL
ncbi:SDR family oxidoreductase [Kangiella sediminilitoris]|uniref:Short-chain dehydrogenase n=1 Tax=Kangiella sediminilitoris TaxID=1144748 RepID=A0A1B3BDG9_9GAMM|nr:SDR family oxidoreductase [Kangiella sediminilitoris]AOE50737.1 short-chain dehydrogenase [Kangiella sediminilitoris]